MDWRGFIIPPGILSKLADSFGSSPVLALGELGGPHCPQPTVPHRSACPSPVLVDSVQTVGEAAGAAPGSACPTADPCYPSSAHQEHSARPNLKM